SGQAGQSGVRRVRRISHLPPRASHHDSDPEHVVPAGGHQSSEVFEHLRGLGDGFPEGDTARLLFTEHAVSSESRPLETAGPRSALKWIPDCGLKNRLRAAWFSFPNPQSAIVNPQSKRP